MTDQKISMVDLASEYAQVGPAIEQAVLGVLRSGKYVLGPETEAFEQELAEFVGTRFAVGVGSGTEALCLALRALGVGPGDQVITSPFTYFATIEAILFTGAEPVFVDIEASGFGIDPALLEGAINARTKAIMPVHLFGRCADMPAIHRVARAHGLAVVEDAAQSIGASRAGHKAGAWGSAGCFSFYPSKNLGAAGDGGCVTTDDADLAEKLRLLRAHGFKGPDQHVLVGTTSRLDSLQAAVLRSKLPFLAGWVERRVRCAQLYSEGLADCGGIRLPHCEDGEIHVWNQFAIRCQEPARVRSALDAAGIEWRQFYVRPASAQPALRGMPCASGRFPQAEQRCAEVVCLPIHPFLEKEQIERVISVIRGALGA